MTARKTNVSKAPTKLSTNISPKTRKARASRTARNAANVVSSARRAAPSGFDLAGLDFARFVTPGLAVLASGALATAGYLFRDQIGELAVDALKVAAKNGSTAAHAASKAVDATRHESAEIVDAISSKISIDSLLRHAGLRHRRTFGSVVGSVVGPAVGVTVGFVAGAALTYFFARRGSEKANSETATTDTSSENHSEGDDSTVAAPPAANEVTHTNGGVRRGIS
jgi:hypothetical protein